MSDNQSKLPIIFVFGSNLAGRHGKGSALFAKRNHGAIYGQGVGPQGTSYAIPTKDENLKVISLERIKNYVDTFIEYAKQHPELKFQVTRVGCGLAGYKVEQIAPMFADAPDNCKFDWYGEAYGEPKRDLPLFDEHRVS